MKKIAHVFSHFNIGGAQTMLVDIMNVQILSCKVTLIILLDDFSSELVKSLNKKIHIIYLNRKKGSLNYFPYVKLNLIINFGGYDIIHLHEMTMWKHIYVGPWVKKYQTVHNTGLFSKYYKRCVKIFAISESVKEGLIKKGFSNVVLAPNGIDCSLIEQKSDNYYQNQSFKIVQVSRLIIKHKGQDILINAIYELKKMGVQHVTVDFIGDGYDKQNLMNLVNKLGLKNEIIFLGKRDRNYVYSHLKYYDLFVQPSRYEGFGLTVAEAMAAKLPVLVSKNEGPYEIINKGEFGYYFENGSSKSLANKILYIIEHYGEAMDKAKNGVLFVNENYNVSNTANLYLKEYFSNVKQ